MPRRGSVVSHWHTLIDDFNTSGLDFYKSVEEAVRRREVPNASFSRVEWREGGFGSAKRTYLRVEQRRTAFDVCAAPFGNGYFFSWWLCRLGPKYPLLMFVLLLILWVPLPAWIAFALRATMSYWILGPLLFLGASVLILACAHEGMFGAEEEVLGIPVFGWVYAKVFGPVTYYSLDSALMFQESVRRAVNEVIDHVLSEKGQRALAEDDKRPTIRDLAALDRGR